MIKIPLEVKRWSYFILGCVGLVLIHPALPITLWATTSFFMTFEDKV